KLLIITSIFYYTSYSRVSIEYLNPKLLTRYILGLLHSSINKSVLILTISSLFLNTTMKPSFNMITLNINYYNVAFQLNIIKNIVNGKIKNDMLKTIMTIIIFRHDILPDNCLDIKNVIVFYCDFPELQRYILQYYNNTEEQFMNMFITAAISNSEFITNSNSRCEVFEYFSSVNINFDILNTIN
ncbi:hypothetical protein TCON_2846, partial [Astathelohania contejeani]